MNHLTALADERALRVKDRACIKGYTCICGEVGAVLTCHLVCYICCAKAIISPQFFLQGCKLVIAIGIENILKLLLH